MKVFLIIGHLSCGPLMILLMYLFYAFPPQQTNSIYGYRTNRSMQNQEVWRFANNTSAKYMLFISLLTTIMQTLFILMGYRSADGLLISFAILLLFLGWGIWKTEKALNKYFDKNGNKL